MKLSWKEVYPLGCQTHEEKVSGCAFFSNYILVNPSNTTKEAHICQTYPSINNMVYVALICIALEFVFAFLRALSGFFLRENY